MIGTLGYKAGRGTAARGCSGFTLLEIVIAISILAIVLGVTYSALNGIIRTKKILDDGRDARYIANAILGRLSRELQLTTSEVTLMPPAEESGRKAPLRVSLVGESRSLSNGEKGDSISFVAKEAGQYVPDGVPHSGLVQITYRVAEPSGSRRGDGYSLIRDETPYSRPFAQAYEKTISFEVTADLVGLELLYYSSQESRWIETWTEDSLDRMPSLVRFKVKIRSPEGRIETYSSMVPLRSINN